MSRQYTLAKKVEQCRSCKAPVLWAYPKTGTDKPAILDATPIFRLKEDPPSSIPMKGTLFVDSNGTGDLIARGAHQIGALILPEAVYASHFASCPDADKWRNSAA